MIKETTNKEKYTMKNNNLNLYNWKVEELKLLKLRRYTGEFFEIENYTLDDKISILDAHYNGVVSYLVDITRQYNSYLANLGEHKALSLNVWLKKNDKKGIMSKEGYWEAPIFYDFKKQGLSEEDIATNINKSFSVFVNHLIKKEVRYAEENNLKFVGVNRVPQIKDTQFGRSKIPCEKFIGDLICEIYNYDLDCIIPSSFKPFLQEVINGNSNAIENLDSSIIQSIIDYLIKTSEYDTNDFLFQYDVTKKMLVTLKTLCLNGSMEQILKTDLKEEVNDIKKSIVEEIMKHI